MTHAELLRSHADTALREGGMYYSGEYLSRMASVAESLESENAKLRELVRDMWEYIYIGTAQDGQRLHDRTRELGIEVTA